jgi:hypothetical protein
MSTAYPLQWPDGCLIVARIRELRAFDGWPQSRPPSFPVQNRGAR